MDIKLAAKNSQLLLPKCHSHSLGDSATTITHVNNMLQKIILEEIEGEKAHRWLGWAQAIICARGAATLDELKEINNPRGTNE